MDDLDLIVKAAEAAGDIALKYWKTDHKTWDKADNAGPVTEADLAVDDMLKERLLSACPDYGWLSEETEDNTERLNKSKVFVVDPIDGTRSFAAGDATWAHSIAVVEDHKPIAAVVYLPARGKIYVATREKAERDGSGIRTSNRTSLDGAGMLCPQSVLQAPIWKGAVPDIKRHFRPSLAYRMALVGEGRFDGMVTLRPAWEWDIAAGALIIEAAGGTVTDQSGAPLKFNSESAQAPSVVCAGPDTHRLLLDGLTP